jgi:hypothetical protein
MAPGRPYGWQTDVVVVASDAPASDSGSSEKISDNSWPGRSVAFDREENVRDSGVVFSRFQSRCSSHTSRTQPTAFRLPERDAVRRVRALRARCPPTAINDRMRKGVFA